jgi:hypothetical protein
MNPARRSISVAVEDSEGSTPLPEEVEQSPVAPRSWSLRIDQLIERWWQDHFPGSAIARDTQAWNVAHAAKETLKRLLKGSI